MGRTSSRLAAHKRPTTRVESEGEHSDDNEDEWTYPEKKGGMGPRVSKKMKKDRFVLANVPPPRKSSTKPIKGNNYCCSCQLCYIVVTINYYCCRCYEILAKI